MLFNFFVKNDGGLSKEQRNSIVNVLGIKPTNFSVFAAALVHRSHKEQTSQNNERLEYLGDAVLGTVVADYLFKRYPLKGEGFLTEMRSKMVNRLYLNEVAMKMGIQRITQYNKSDASLRSSGIFGNTLEAIVGAVYLDKGYSKAQAWILNQIVIPHMSVDSLEGVDINLKNKLIGWASRNNKELKFELGEEKLDGPRRIFIMNTVLEGEILSQGKGFNKKEASQAAAIAAVEKLNL